MKDIMIARYVLTYLQLPLFPTYKMGAFPRKDSFSQTTYHANKVFLSSIPPANLIFQSETYKLSAHGK
ncbi:hypothetical protein PspKH34_30230 [Parageobacillus sp. KH3-4]|nr:hypothetical protein PspKH34_30230 [Parageobacillus sp. KH3-4]